MYIGVATTKNSLEAAQNTNTRFAIGSSNTTSGHVSGQNCNSKRYRHPTFIAAQFVIATTWKQPQRPLTDGKRRVLHPCNGILRSYEKNVAMPSAATWMGLEMITLSEIRQKEKDK